MKVFRKSRFRNRGISLFNEIGNKILPLLARRRNFGTPIRARKNRNLLANLKAFIDLQEEILS